jgi:hypothetical protein
LCGARRPTEGAAGEVGGQRIEARRRVHEQGVAGILEDGDCGEEGIRQRAALEALEKAGLRIPAERFARLGGKILGDLVVSDNRRQWQSQRGPGARNQQTTEELAASRFNRS